MDYGLLVCRLKYDVIKERVRFLGSVIVEDDGGGSGGGRIRKDMLRSDNEEFDVGCRFRDEDGFKVAVGFVLGIH